MLASSALIALALGLAPALADEGAAARQTAPPTPTDPASDPAPLPASDPVPAPAAPAAQASAQTLALEEERNRRMTIPVTIAGAGPFAFMIDTGSQATAVTHEVNAALGLTPSGTATLIGMASERAVDLVEVPSLRFGDYEVFDLVSPVLARAHVGADGIIGLDSLQDLRVVIDFRKGTIALDDVSARQARAGFEIVVRARQQLGQLLITDAIVEGVRATVIIDTGAQGSIGNIALQERLRARRAEEVTTTDVNGVSLVGDLAIVRNLTIEGLSLTNVPLAFADAPAFAALGLNDQPVLSLGMQHLKLFDRVAIDFSRRRIAFDVPGDVARAMRRARRHGFRADIN